jgi:hypothetical protein
MGHQSQLLGYLVDVKVFNSLQGIYENFFTAMRFLVRPVDSPYGKQNVCNE